MPKPLVPNLSRSKLSIFLGLLANILAASCSGLEATLQVLTCYQAMGFLSLHWEKILPSFWTEISLPSYAPGLFSCTLCANLFGLRLFCPFRFSSEAYQTAKSFHVWNEVRGFPLSFVLQSLFLWLTRSIVNNILDFATCFSSMFVVMSFLSYLIKPLERAPRNHLSPYRGAPFLFL